MEFQQATVTHMVQISSRVTQFTLSVDEPFEYTPGQHTVIRFELDGEEVMRPYTITNLPGTETFCLVIKEYEDGTASRWMCDRAVGDTVEVSEPKGNLFLRNLDRDVVFVSTGTGATPMLPMLKQYLREGSGTAWYFHGERTREDLFFQETLEHLRAEHENLHVIYSLSDETWSGREGHVQDHIYDVLSFDSKDFYVCGVPQMVVDTEQLLGKHGVAPDHIFTEGWEEDAV